MKTFKTKYFQIKYIIAALIVLLAASFGGYYAYANNHCISLTSKRSSYIKNGEVYIQLKDKDGNPQQYVKRDIFLSMCMDNKFRL